MEEKSDQGLLVCFLHWDGIAQFITWKVPFYKFSSENENLYLGLRLLIGMADQTDLDQTHPGQI